MSLSCNSNDLFVDSLDSIEDGGVSDIRKNLLSELSAESPTKASMPPPPVPNSLDSEKMRVFLRIRPLSTEEEARNENQGCVVVKTSTQVDMIAPKSSKTYEHSVHGCGKTITSYSFNRIYDELTSQKVLFEDCMLDMVKDFVGGQNCLCFAYGVTNSGKTYTMLGSAKEQGIVPQSLELIFNSIGDKQYEACDLKPKLYSEVKKLSMNEMNDAEKFKTMVMDAATKMTVDPSYMYASCDSLASQSSIGESILEGGDYGGRSSIGMEGQENIRFSLWVSFAEIYNDQIHDLLEPLAKTIKLEKKRKTMNLREDKHGNPYIKDLKHIQVTSADEALKVLTFGQRNLQYACTKLNESSSRSHCIFTIKVIRVADTVNPHTAYMSQFSFCDLAGSERTSRTGNVGERLKEASNINISLSTLGRCIKMLRENQLGKTSKDKVVPFRESKLTRLFQTFFSGKGKACMLVNINPSASSFDENMQVLKFSAIAKQVQIVAEKPVIPKKTQLSIAQEQGDGRDTISWASAEERKEFADLSELKEEDEDGDEACSPRYAEHMEVINKLKKTLIEADLMLKKERREKRELEPKLREEISKQLIEQLSEIDDRNEQRMAEEKQQWEEHSENKVKRITAAIYKSEERKREELNAKLSQVEEELVLAQEKIARLESLNTEKNNDKEEKEPHSDEEEKEPRRDEEKEPRRGEEEESEMMLDLRQKLATMEQELRETRDELEAAKATISGFNTELAGKSALSTELTEVKCELEELRTSSANQLETRKEAMDKLTLESLKKSQEISQLRRELTEIEAVHTTALSEQDKKYELTVKELEMEVLAVSRGLQASDKAKEEVEKSLEEMKERVESLEAELTDRTVKLESYQSETEQLKLQIAQRTEEYDSLVTEMGQLKETLHKLESLDSSKEMENKCNSLTANMKKLQDQLRRRSVEWQGDLGTVQTQLLASRKELERIKKEKEKLNQLNKDYQSDIQETRTKYAAITDELADVTEEYTELKQKHKEANSAISTLTSNQKQLEIKLADELCTKTELEMEKHNLRDLLQKSEGQSSMLESTVYRLRKEINGYTEQITKLESLSSEEEIKELKNEQEKDKAALKIKSEENLALKDELASLQGMVKETEARCKKLATLDARVKDVNEKLDQQKKLHEEATYKIQQLTSENNSLREQNSQHSVSDLEKEIKMLKEDLRGKESKASSLQVILEARESEFDRKEDAFKSFKHKAQKTEELLNTEKAKLQDDLTKMSNELETFQQNISTSTALNSSSQTKISGLEKDLADAQERLKEVTEKLSSKHRSSELITQKDKLIEEYKAALLEQESTAKIQDEVLKSKEKEIYNLTQEMCELRLKGQDIVDKEIENSSLQYKLKSVVHEREILSEAQAKATSDVDELNHKTSILESQVTELKKVVKEKDGEIESLQEQAFAANDNNEILKKMTGLEQKVVRKDKIILQLEQKIRGQEKTINNLVGAPSSGRVTRQAYNQAEDSEKIQSLETRCRETEQTLERMLAENDHLRDANLKLQKQLEAVPPRRASDRFKEPVFCNDTELSASTLQLDVTPMSSSKKQSRSTRKGTKSKKDSVQKENRPSTLKRIRNAVEKSTSSLASPAKKILSLRITPLKDSPSEDNVAVPLNSATSEQDLSAKPKRRRKLYNVEENTLTADSTPKDPVGRRTRGAAANVHSIVSRNMKNMHPK